MFRKITLEILCMAFIALFVYAGMSKLLDQHLFVIQISQNSLLKPFAGILSILLPISEIIIAIMISVSRWRAWGLYAFTSLMFIFTIYIAVILMFSKHLPCSCGGVLSKMHWKEHLVFNIVIVILGLLAIYILRKKNNLSQTQFA